MSRNTATTDEPFAAGEFVEIEYTARIADDGTVVDTTDPEVAVESGLEGVGTGGSVVVVLGEGHVFGPVENAITELRPGERRTVTVEPADAFGETDPARRHSIPVDALADGPVEQNDRVTLDGRVGHVDIVDNGTATVDFNHPLAGTTLEYEVRAVDRVVETGERTAGLLQLYDLRDDITYTTDDGVLACSVTLSSVPSEGWYGRKRQFLGAATELLDVDEVRVEERYATGSVTHD